MRKASAQKNDGMAKIKNASMFHRLQYIMAFISGKVKDAKDLSLFRRLAPFAATSSFSTALPLTIYFCTHYGIAMLWIQGTVMSYIMTVVMVLATFAGCIVSLSNVAKTMEALAGDGKFLAYCFAILLEITMICAQYDHWSARVISISSLILIIFANWQKYTYNLLIGK